MKATRRTALITQSGDIWSINLPRLASALPYRKRFCGLPKGIRSEPRIAAMFSIEITGRMYFSLPAARNRVMVSGTKMRSETSFVTNIDEKNTPNTKKSVSEVILPSFEPSLTTG